MLVGTRSFMLRRQLAIGGYGADRGIAWQCPPRPPPVALLMSCWGLPACLCHRAHSEGRWGNASLSLPLLRRCQSGPLCGCLVEWPSSVRSQPALPRTQTSTWAG